MFDTRIYEGRRERLRDLLDGGLLLFLGNEDSPMNFPDNIYPFRQDSHFLYFFGLDRPHLAAVIDLDEGQTTVYGDELTLDHIIWMGPQPSLADQAEQAGVENTAPYGTLEGVLAQAVKAGRKVHFLPPYRADNQIKLSRWLEMPLDEVNQGASEELIRAVVSLVSRKGPEEVQEMEKAVNITGAMHHAAMRAARPGIKEAELAGIVEGIAVAAGGRLSYPAILTTNGQTLHNQFYGNTLREGQLVLGDFGAETSLHYAGDITRTFPVAATFTPEQKELYNIVLETELACIEVLKTGVRYLDVHLLAARKMTEGLQAMGLMRGDVEAAVAAGAHALFFPHGLGHMIGLDVHDMEGLGEDYVGYTAALRRSDQFGLKSLRLARALEPGFVLTVEPGLYFIPELIDQWRKEKKLEDFIDYEKVEAFRHFSGVRIEDNVLITEDGYRILGDPIAKTVEEVEALRKG